MILETEDDFDPVKIARSGQCFRWTEEMRESGPAFRVIAFGRVLHLRRLKNGKWRLSCTRDVFLRIWRKYFDLDLDYRAVRAMIPPEDAYLAAAAEYAKGIRILRQDPWETLISFIISQNRNIPAIRRSVEKLCETAGKLIREPAAERYGGAAGPEGERARLYAFPTPGAVAGMSGEALDACRLGYRAPYVRKTAELAADGRLNLAAMAALPPKEQMAELTALYGVGVKVAGCVMLFGFHSLDAFPRDVWINRVLDKVYGGFENYPMARYSPYNGIMQQYLFEYGRRSGG